MNLRKLQESDRALLAQWMAADDYHKGFSTDLFFEPGTETLVFVDEHGPILFVNLAKAIRAFVQFAPEAEARTRVALPEAFNFVAVRGKKSGFREIIFESLSRPLIVFCKRYLGFRKSPNEYKALIL